MNTENQSIHNSYRRLTVSDVCDMLMGVKIADIMVHLSPDPDAVGSAFALRGIMEKLGCDVRVICADEASETLGFLTQGVKISAPPRDEASLITVDVASPDQLGHLWEVASGRIMLMLDHHGMGQQFADGIIEPKAAATGEIIYKIAREFLRRGVVDSLPKQVYTSMYAAISADTGSFRHSSTTPETHRIAAELLEMGADARLCARKIHEEKPLSMIKAQMVAIDNIMMTEDGKFAAAVISREKREAAGLAYADFSDISDLMRSISGVLVGASIRESDTESKWRVSMRSIEPVDCSKICARFGGGGHKQAAGCMIMADNAASAYEMIRSSVMDEIKNCEASLAANGGDFRNVK